MIFVLIIIAGVVLIILSDKNTTTKKGEIAKSISSIMAFVVVFGGTITSIAIMPRVGKPRNLQKEISAVIQFKEEGHEMTATEMADLEAKIDEYNKAAKKSNSKAARIAYFPLLEKAKDYKPIEYDLHK